MQAESGDTAQMPPHELSRTAFAAVDERSRSGNITRLVIGVFALNLISAALFIALVKRPVYDDVFNIFDVHNYAEHGLSVVTLLAQRNPPGPTSFLWMAAGIRFLGGDELENARIAILVSWILLAAGILVGARHSAFPHLWYAAFLVTLVFPHAVSASALVLTEGPALLFALLGVLAWIETFSLPEISLRLGLLGILSGLSLGIAVTCRQYFLALLPAAFFFAIYKIRENEGSRNRRWFIAAALSLLAASIPVLTLLFIWKDFSSPGMVMGVSYQGEQARMGLNSSRPFVAAFYVALYILPLTFPAMFRLKTSQRRVALILALAGGASITYFTAFFLQPGPLNSLIRIASRIPHGGTVLFALLAVLVVYNAAAVCFLLYEQRHSLLSCAPAVFALLVVVFFIAEQLGAGGDFPFYDRYVLQIAPFLGLLAFALLPRLTTSRLLALACLSALSHFMLWRFAFGG